MTALTARLESGPNPSSAVRDVFRKLAERGYSVRRGATAVVALVACATAFAVDTAPVDGQAPLPDMDSAALAALRAVPSASVEYAGVIYRADDGFHYTGAVTSDSDHGAQFGVLLPHGAHLEALYHTHPGHGDGLQYFSGIDVATANALRVVSYVGVLMNHEVIRFQPGGKTETHGTHVVARGSHVGNL